MILKTYDKAKKKTIIAGQFYASNFYKKVEYSKHFMRCEQGYGIQDDIILQLKDLECKFIIITDTEIDKVYSSRFEEWVVIKPKDYGNGLQRFLRILKEPPNQTALI
jgi:hypothetical protein